MIQTRSLSEIEERVKAWKLGIEHGTKDVGHPWLFRPSTNEANKHYSLYKKGYNAGRTDWPQS